MVEASGARTVLIFLARRGTGCALKRRGWSENTLKAGDKIAVDGWMSREGGHLANAKSVTMPNGKELNAASSYFEKAPSKKNSH